MLAPVLAVVPLLVPLSPGGDPVPVRVDARVELLTLVFRLIGSPEYNQPQSSSPYAREVELWFGPARDHRACTLAKALRGLRSISYNAVPDLAVHLTPPPELALRVPLEPWPERLDRRWQGVDIEGFLEALRSFAADTGFLEFLATFAEVQRAAEASLGKQVEDSQVLPWLQQFFGLDAGTRYTAVPGLLCGPANYGASVRLADGTLELWPVLGTSAWDAEGRPVYSAGSQSTVVHEFTHAFANPVVDAHWAALEPALERLYPPVAEVMKRQAYASPRILAYESLVRACVVRHTARYRGAEAAQRQIAAEVANGFLWTGELASQLEQYEARREAFPALTAFGGELAAFFRAEAEKRSERAR